VTKILCLNKDLQEEYSPIENLRKGDLVKSYKHGYRKILIYIPSITLLWKIMEITMNGLEYGQMVF